jgi:hypothetical protein
MIEVNPNKIKRAKIVVGIPSFNEADSITFVTKQVDKGLQNYFKSEEKVIINTDNNSPDNTGKVFLKTKTKTPKIYISTPAGVRGKGNNLRNFFLKIKDLKATAAMTVDADIKNITPEWVKCLLNPVINHYDFVTPIYNRHKFDASITNHLCYPLVYGLLGYNIRQPIGGDFGFSKRLVEYWIRQRWPKSARNFGIDIFMTLNAIKFGGRLAQVNLGTKIHKPSAPKLDPMFLEVAETLFRFLKANKNLWDKKIDLKTPPLVCKVGKKIKFQKLSIDYKEIEEKGISEFSNYYKFIKRYKKYLSSKTFGLLEKMFLKEKSLKIDIDLWAKIVYEMFYIYHIASEKEKVIKFLRALYFGRMSCYIKESSLIEDEDSEKIIKSQAIHFFKKRDYLLSLISKGPKNKNKNV